MNEKNKTALQGLGCVGALLIYVANVILGGWALSVLWGWFIAPIFAIPPLDIVPAIGLRLVVGSMTGRALSPQDNTRPFWERLLIQLMVGLMLPVASVGIGWVVQSFM